MVAPQGLCRFDGAGFGVGIVIRQRCRTAGAGEKLRRTAAIQDAKRLPVTPNIREASWSVPDERRGFLQRVEGEAGTRCRASG
jgi:hypothetical protein